MASQQTTAASEQGIPWPLLGGVAALATLDELLDAVRSELPPPKGRRADLGRVRVTIEDAEGGTVEVEDDGDMADAADARCVHVRGWPL